MFTSKDTDYLTHNIHDYPGKFIPQFPQIILKIVKKYDSLKFRSDGDSTNVLDPFCGAGTTLIEACREGLSCVGLDIDPVAHLISRVATTPIESNLLEEHSIRLLSELRERFDAKAWTRIVIPDEVTYPNAVPLWFREETFRQLILIRDTIFGLDLLPAIRDIALLSLSAIVKPVSNADPRDIFPERDLGTPVREKKDVFAEFTAALKERQQKAKSFTAEVGLRQLARVYCSDSRSLPLESESVDLTITSPPYAYALEYARVHQLSTLLFIMSNLELRKLRKEYIGTDRVSLKTEIESFDGFEFAESRVREVLQENRKVGLVLHKYLKDMNTAIGEIERVLRVGGISCIIIGNSTIRGTDFRTCDVLARMCEGHGLTVYRKIERPYYAYRLPRNRAPQSDRIQSDIFIFARKN